MRLYIAAKWEEKARAREVMYELVKAGHSITYDWTSNEEDSSEQTIADINGVISADAYVGIFEKDLNYIGALMEFGAALGTNKPCYILGNAPITNYMFFKHPLVKWGIEELLNGETNN